MFGIAHARSGSTSRALNFAIRAAWLAAWILAPLWHALAASAAGSGATPSHAASEPVRTPARASSDSIAPKGPAGAGTGAAARAPSRAEPAGADTVLLGMPQVSDVPLFWRTRAERSGFHLTADYAETMRYLRQLEGGSDWLRLVSFGKSGQGRDLPMLIVSRDHAFTPEAARASGKPVVLIQNGIHAGEIEGKDASLALVRDLAVLRRQSRLLDHVILLVVPMLSADAHERRSAFNRINQNGPDEMGWRYTPIGLNLNRDYLKAETPEMRALIGQVFTRWWPDLLVDNHTSDGANFRYDLGYSFNFGPEAPAPAAAWLTRAFEARAIPAYAALGHLVAPYLDFDHAGDPAAGAEIFEAEPRYSNGYASIQCRPGILIETHSLKSYEVRVRATYDLMVALLAELDARPSDLKRAVAESESLVAVHAFAPAGYRGVSLLSKPGPRQMPLAFKGYRRTEDKSEITGAPIGRFLETPLDTTILYRGELKSTLDVIEPPGYLVPQEWTTVAEHLALHGVRFQRLSVAWSDTVEVPHVLAWRESTGTFEGHHVTIVTEVRLEHRWRTYRPGDLWVPCDQPRALVAMQLLETRAPDGLMFWNAFDTVLERKEYAEAYVMEPIARRMLLEQPELAAEFRARLAADTAFARSPKARLDFFYRRSPWFDTEADLAPVTRALKPPPASVLAR
ncbi:MAG: M14 family metallopeptidase [Candidatus Eiseniibacteriota bacterium]